MIVDIFWIQVFISIIDFLDCQNLAYKKPAFQSSFYSYYGLKYTADRAVDDKLGSSLWNGDCSHTNQNNDKDWFVLDLQDEYFIDFVLVFGRDERPERMNYFVVGLSNSFNSLSSPTRGSYDLCGQYTLRPYRKDIMTVNCFYQNIAAKYIIIQPPINGPGEITICNLEVYGAKYRNITYIGCYSNVKIRSQYRIESDLNINSISLCAEKCRIASTTYSTINNDICSCINEVQSSLPSTQCFSDFKINQAFPIYTSCPLGLFGLNCEYVCHCRDEVQCNILDGTCPNMCANNWSGHSCNISIPTYLGCEYDKNQSFFTSLQVTNDADLLTNELCSNVCLKNKFIFSATKNTQCYCANEINYQIIYESFYCTYKCPGNDTQNCGDSNYKSTYAICPTNYFGYKCQYECHCKNNGICSNINGNCSNGCANGWSGAGCHIADCSLKKRKCGQNEICQVANNFSICECKDGFFKMNEYQNCTDIDECALKIDNCSRTTEVCENYKGFYNCSCKQGFHYNYSQECVDLDECLFNESSCNLTTHTCLNTLGSFQCVLLDMTDEIGVVNNSPLIAAMTSSCVILLLILLIIIVVIIIYRKKWHSRLAIKSKTDQEKLAGQQSTQSARNSNLLQAKNPNSDEYIEFSRMNLFLKDIPEYYKNSKQQIENEFANAPVEIIASGEYGRQKIFKDKNRFKNVVPYDNNRVKLNILNNDSLTDYINASYINLPDYENIIATQGPNKFTINDFWRMVDEQNVGVIVMLCNITENDKIKCNQYWPHEGSEAYGSVLIQFLEEITWPEYKCRRFLLQSEKSVGREVLQWHYTIWPDHGVPCCSASILHFIQRFRESLKVSRNKALIHCSAGIGRTGCFLAIDRLLLEANRGSSLDVAQCLGELRMQRPQLVQTQVQYNFIYECLVMEAELGPTLFTLDNFKIRFNDSNPQTLNNNKILHQFKVIMKEMDEPKTSKKKKVPTATLR